MVKKLFKYTTLLLMGSLSFNNLKASDYKLVTRLSGYWKFSIGDDPAWSNPNFDDSDWDQIYAPSDWEKNGYNDYNGYAWYRKKIEVHNVPDNVPLFLLLGKIDDVDEVYINGKLVGKTGEFPPMYKTAYSVSRKYAIPKGLLNINGANVIAIKIYDAWGQGGIRSGDLGIYTDADFSLIDIPLHGPWKFNLGNKREWRNPDYDDSKWDQIHVPGSWESQGYPDYDGYACYRRKVVIPNNMQNRDKFLSLGKIDDIDEVYFNGHFIGTVYDLISKYDQRKNGREYTIPRIYYIPENIIRYGKANVITVVVYDIKSRGGIYEGPVGIMYDYNYEKYRNKNNEPSTFWDLLYEWLVD